MPDPSEPAGPPVPAGPERLTILRDGAEAYPEMLRAIATARRSICLQAYVVRSDRTGWSFEAAFAGRARDGVEVSLMYDAWGSSVTTRFLEALHEAGGRTLAFHPVRFSGPFGRGVARIRKRGHRKTLVIDGEVAFVGGTNIADEYAPADQGGGGWRDTHVRIDGPAAMDAQRLFVETWLGAGGAAFRSTRAEAGAAPTGAVRIVGERLHGDRRRVRAEYLRAIASARARIAITNAYFLPTLAIRRALAKAARRGVSVSVILPGTTDLPLVRLASQHHVRAPAPARHPAVRVDRTRPAREGRGRGWPVGHDWLVEPGHALASSEPRGQYRRRGRGVRRRARSGVPR